MAANMDINSKIQDLQHKIEIELKCKEGAENMLKKLTDKGAYQQCELNVIESQRRLDFLMGEMEKLQLRKRRLGGESMPELIAKEPSNELVVPPMPMYRDPRAKRLSDPGSPTYFTSNGVGQASTNGGPTRTLTTGGSMFGSILGALGVKSRSGTLLPKSSSMGSLSAFTGSELYGWRQAVTQFDYLMCDTPITSGKIKYKLNEIRFKVDVEQKVKAGTERMQQAMEHSAETDRRRQQEVLEKVAESNAKVAILMKAQQRYQGLYLVDDEEKDLSTAPATTPAIPATIPEDGGESGAASNTPIKSNRRPISGKLKAKLVAATGLPGKRSHRTDTFAVIRVDGVQKAKTRPSRSKWNEEFDVMVDRAQEVELAVYEKGGSILALVWFKLWELEEHLKIQPKGVIRNPSTSSLGTGIAPVGGSVSVATVRLPEANAGTVGGATSSTSPTEGIETWLELEPAGQLFVKLNFVPEVVKKRQNEGVTRRKPVQKFFPKRGHKFVAMQFYQVMTCAICNEFLMSGQGYQCQSCKYTCHKKCQGRVITQCITKFDIEKEEPSDGDAMLKHRIPHRFETTTNLSPNWCCHCGYMLPLGKKQAMKCTECSIMCHNDCRHLVPNFCGLTAVLIDQMKIAIDQAERVKREKETFRNDYLVSKDAQDRLAKEQQQFQTVPLPPQQFLSLQQLPPVQQDSQSLEEQMQLEITPPTPIITVQKPEVMPSAQSSPQPPKSPVIVQATKPKTDTSPHGSQQTTHSVLMGSGPKGIGLDDFNFLAVLGKGNFGKVMLAEEKYNKQLYAIKVLKKEFIIENDEVESTKSEKRVFLTANRERHPFLVNLHSCFQTESRIYFVMEYVSGGDLMWHIQHQQFSEKRAKFYASEVLLALEYFHKNDIIYRDLKLDNILLSLDGHIKIADYGLCKESMTYGATTNTFCGTPEFMAPEILLEKPYTRAVDWWAFGVLIYEMLLGQSPFRGEDEDEIFEAILDDEILYPVNMAKDAVTLLQKLLTKDPAKRLGAGRSDAEEIKRHPFFKGMDWDALLTLKVAPPFYPSISSPTDVSNFDEEFTKEEPVLTPCNSVLSAADQEEFRGFTYISDWAQASRARATGTPPGGHPVLQNR